jgi:hypothetical protein
LKSKVLRFGLLVGAATVLAATPAYAHDCVNSSKNPTSPTVIVGVECAPDGSDVLTVKQGVQQRVEKFGLDENGDPLFNFHGPIGLDFNCDGTADIITYEPGGGTDGVIPAAHNADGQNRENCTGMTDFDDAFENGCVELG